MRGRPAKYSPEATADTKRCTKCGTVRRHADFYPDPSGIAGRRSECKECRKAGSRHYAGRVATGGRVKVGDKVCPACETRKPASAFAPNKYHRSGLQSHCKICRVEKNRWWQIKATYGLTREQYEAMFASQDGLCAICGDGPEKSKRGVLHVDHCHASGKVRGLLCESCNLAIGKLKDSPEVLRRAAGYLEAAK